MMPFLDDAKVIAVIGHSFAAIKDVKEQLKAALPCVEFFDNVRLSPARTFAEMQMTAGPLERPTIVVVFDLSRAATFFNQADAAVVVTPLHAWVIKDGIAYDLGAPDRIKARWYEPLPATGAAGPHDDIIRRIWADGSQ
jgi:hypothetical protein